MLGADYKITKKRLKTFHLTWVVCAFFLCLHAYGSIPPHGHSSINDESNIVTVPAKSIVPTQKNINPIIDSVPPQIETNSPEKESTEIIYPRENQNELTFLKSVFPKPFHFKRTRIPILKQHIPLSILLSLKIESTIRDFENNQASNSPKDAEFHQVAPKETLYSIAKKYHTKPDLIIKLNKLNSPKLSLGQLLIIPKQATVQNTIQEESMPPIAEQNRVAPPPTPLRIDDSNVSNPIVTDSTSNSFNERKIVINKFGLKEIQEKGFGIWQTSPLLTEGKSVALHRSAPVGTVMKISTDKNKRSVFVKVAGAIPNETPSNIDLIITKSAATSLGLIGKDKNDTSSSDKPFVAHMAYGSHGE